MKQANEIMRKFLRQQRIRAGVSLNAVAKGIKQPLKNVQAWEDQPVNAPLNRIAKMVEFYQTNSLEFLECLFEVRQAQRQASLII